MTNNESAKYLAVVGSFIIGIVGLVIALYVLIWYSKSHESIILIIYCFLSAIIYLLASYVVAKEQNFISLLCASLMLLTLLFDIILGICAEWIFYYLAEHYEERKGTFVREFVSLVQSNSCCGINGPGDWGSRFHNSTRPPSCCTEFNVDEVSQCNQQYSHQIGCSKKIFHYLGVIIIIRIILFIIIFYVLRILRCRNNQIRTSDVIVESNSHPLIHVQPQNYTTEQSIISSSTAFHA